SRQQRRSSEDLHIGSEDPMRRHGLDLLANLDNGTRSSCIRRLQNTDCMHQLLNGDGRVVDLSLRNQVIQYLWRAALHLIDIDASIEQKALPADHVHVDERKLAVSSTWQSSSRIEPRPASRGIKIERRHLRIRVSALDRFCLGISGTRPRSCPQARLMPARTRSSPYRSRCPFAAWLARPVPGSPCRQSGRFSRSEDRIVPPPA